MKYKEQLKGLTAEEQTKWAAVLEDLDREEANNDRKHKNHRDGMDTTIVDQSPEEWKAYPVAKMLSLSRPSDWIEIIFSKRYGDLYQLMSNPEISKAIEALTDKQKQAMFLHYVKQYTPQEIGEMTGTTDRNIRKHCDKAIKSIQAAIGILNDKSGEGYLDTVAIVLFWMVLPTFAISWAVTKRMYPKLKQMVTGKAA